MNVRMIFLFFQQMRNIY